MATYVSGGVDFTRVLRVHLSSDSFRRAWSSLSRTVDMCLHAPTCDRDEREVWLGGQAAADLQRSRAAARWLLRTGFCVLTIGVLVSVVGGVVATLLVLYLLRRRPRRQSVARPGSPW